MNFQIELAGSKPVYLQLIDQVKLAFAAGRLRPGDRLPPIRDVAAQVRVNRNTVARVYAELEREGIVYSRPGQGCFISDRGSSLARSEQTSQLSQRLDDLIAQAHLYDLSRDQLTDLFHKRLDAILPDASDDSNSSKTKGARK